jgi:hypothetical protein
MATSLYNTSILPPHLNNTQIALIRICRLLLNQ